MDLTLTPLAVGERLSMGIAEDALKLMKMKIMWVLLKPEYWMYVVPLRAYY